MAAIAGPIDSTLDSVEKDFESLRLIEPRPHILSVSECQTDHTALRRILDNTQWRLVTARSCHEAFEKLSSKRPMVALCESSLPDGTWKDVLAATTRFNDPRPVLVVTSAFADESLWSEVFRLGGYDVLTKPLIEDQVLRLLASIWTGRARRVRTSGGAS